MEKALLKIKLDVAEVCLKYICQFQNDRFTDKVKRILHNCFLCEELLDKSSKDKLIQLDTSVSDDKNNRYIDAIFLDKDTNEVRFSVSNMSDGENIQSLNIEDIDNERVILKVVHQLKSMCV